MKFDDEAILVPEIGTVWAKRLDRQRKRLENDILKNDIIATLVASSLSVAALVIFWGACCKESPLNVKHFEINIVIS